MKQVLIKLLCLTGVGLSGIPGWGQGSQDDLDISHMLGSVDSSNILISDNWYTWGASVVKGEDGKFHLFYARWPHGKHTDTDDSLNYIFNGFAGWNKYSEIAYAVSDKLTGPYHYVRTVLKGTGDLHRWDRFTYHNPLIRKFKGWYYLYFISNSFDSAYQLRQGGSRQALQWMRYNCTQKIGVVKAHTLDDLVNGRYASSGNFLVAPDNQQTFEVATNPAVTEGPDGKYYMMYKSRTPSPGHMTFWMATGDKPDGPFTTISAVLNTADMACEDPSLWYDKKRKRFYAAAKYFSNAKILAPESGALVLITSADGLHWTSARQSLISLKQLKFSDGHTEKLARLERPFVVVDAEGQPVALFSAASVQSPAGGDPEHVIPANNSFNVQIPLLKQK